ncbi:hypothetical protein Taitung21_00010 [Helicobacter pylori]
MVIVKGCRHKKIRRDISQFLAIEKSLISLLPLKGCEFGYKENLYQVLLEWIRKSDWIDPYNFSNQLFNSD